MILKGSQRKNGADLAVHLMNSFDNESVEIAEIYGTVADDLLGAFAEFEAVSLGTKAREYLYSLSINPPSPLTRAQYSEAIKDIEHRLGLEGQPRAIVFHVKDGREHCHVVWSRIDVEHMKAVQMSHDRRKLMDLACDLGRKFGLDLPPGLKAWEEKRQHQKDELEATLGEKAQAEATGISPEQRSQEITACYEQSDTPAAFIQALEQRSYVLAKGDKRGFVVVDKFGAPYSLSRYVKGHKAGAIRKKLAGLDPAQLPSVDDAKEMQRQRRQAEQDRKHELTTTVRRLKKKVFAELQASRRAEILEAEQQLLTRHQAETLSLHAAQASEAQGLVFRLRSAVADLVGRTPGLRSVLAHIQNLTHLDPCDRHRLENEALIRRHERERLEFERQKRLASRLETRERQSLERELAREERLARELEGKAKHDFAEAVEIPATHKNTVMGEGDLQVAFNIAAEFQQEPDSDDDSGNEERALRPKQQLQKNQQRGVKRKDRGRGSWGES